MKFWKENYPFVLFGWFLWWAAATMIRWWGAGVWQMGSWAVALVYVGTIPFTYGLLVLLQRWGRIPHHLLIQRLVVVTFSYALLDGVALMAFTDWYHHSKELALYGAAWIIWSTGWALLLAYGMAARQA